MKFAIMRMGYDVTYAIPVTELSKFLEMLNKCQMVNNSYIPHLDRNVVYKDPRSYKPELYLVDEILDKKPEEPKDSP